MAEKKIRVLMELKGGGGGGAVENLYNDLGYGYVIDNKYFEKLAEDSYEITKDWVEYYANGLVRGKLVSFIPNLPVTTTNMSGMFQNCLFLQSIPLLDTSNVTNMTSMFNGCSSLQSIPLLDTSNVTNMCSGLSSGGFFNGCSSLQSIPLLDTSNVTNIAYMFYDCSSLQSIPLLDTSKATNINGMFTNCSALKSLPKLDFSSVTTAPTYSTSFLRGNSSSTATTNQYPSLTDLGGFTGLKVTFWLNSCQSLTEQSIINVFNEMADLTGETAQTIHLGSINIAKCSPETLQIATDKNWIVA